jgi:hypothetical protein
VKSRSAPQAKRRKKAQKTSANASLSKAAPWDCGACTLINDTNALVCAACETQRPQQGPTAAAEVFVSTAVPPIASTSTRKKRSQSGGMRGERVGVARQTRARRGKGSKNRKETALRAASPTRRLPDPHLMSSSSQSVHSGSFKFDFKSLSLKVGGVRCITSLSPLHAYLSSPFLTAHIKSHRSYKTTSHCRFSQDDAELRPLYVCPTMHIFLETFSPIYQQVFFDINLDQT